MISFFVKVDGKLQRYGTHYHSKEAYWVIDPLRKEVKGSLPAKAKTISPVLALIQPTTDKNEQFVLPF